MASRTYTIAGSKRAELRLQITSHVKPDMAELVILKQTVASIEISLPLTPTGPCAMSNNYVNHDR